MPIREFKCEDGHVSDELIRSSDPVPQTITCWCGLEARLQISTFARTPGTFGDSTAYFDRGLGCVVRNNQHREQLMKAKGLTPLSDYASGTVENAVHAQIEQKKQHERTVTAYKDNLKKHGGDTAMAVADTFPSRT